MPECILERFGRSAKREGKGYGSAGELASPGTGGLQSARRATFASLQPVSEARQHIKHPAAL